MLLGTLQRRGGRAALWLVVGLLIGGTVGAAATYLLKRGKAGIPGGPRLSEATEMSYVPPDSAGFIHIRLRDVWNTEGFAELRKIIEQAGPQAKAAIDESFVPAPSTIDRMTLVFVKTPPRTDVAPPPMPGPGPKGPNQPRKNAQPKKGGLAPPPPPPPPPLPGKLPIGPVGPVGPAGGFAGDVLPDFGGGMKVVVVLAFTTPFDAAKVRDTYLKAGVQKKVGDREYWDDSVSAFAAYFPSDTVMVLGDGEGMKLYLTRLATPTGPLESAIAHAKDGSRHIVAAINVAHFGITAAMFQGAGEEFKDLAKHAHAILKAESIMIGLALADETRIDIRAKYKDDATAVESEAALREMAKLGREKLAEPKKKMEETLNGPPGAPKPRPIKDLPMAVAGLFGLGSINALDEWLADPPLKTEGSEVILTPKVPSLAAIYAGTAASAFGMLGSATEKVQMSATRMKDSNNLKQLGIAMHSYHDATGALPSQDGKGFGNTKGGLSWRVHMLPYIEQDNLYKQFHLDEPWDSEHNKKLIAQMPVTYASPFVADPPGQTRYKVFSSTDAVIYPGSKTTMASITDGTSNTIMIVGGGKPVIWTQPDDIDASGFVAPSSLMPPGQSGCNFCLCDGSVRWVDLNRLSPTTLKAAITRSGGEVLGADW